MAQVVYTPELGAGSGSLSQTVPQNSSSLADSFGQAFKASMGYVGNTIKDAFKEQGDRMTNYGQTTALAPHLTENSQAAYDFAQNNTDKYNEVLSSGGTSAKSAGDYNLSGILGSSAFANNNALQAMYDMFQKTGDISWLEKMIDSYGSIENTESARAWEKMMSDTSFSRLIDDIKSKGYNPWLALQNGSFGQASSYNTSAASVGNTSPSQQAVSRANNTATVNANNIRTASTIMSAVLTVALIALRMAIY